MLKKGSLLLILVAIFLAAHFVSGDALALTISNVMVSNLTSSAAVVSWETDSPAGGSVSYGTVCGSLTSSASDTRTDDDIHYVQITGLTPETPYFFSVTSGGVTDDNGGSCHTFTTTKVGSGTSYILYGKVLLNDGTTPAGSAPPTQAIKYIMVAKAGGVPVSYLLSALTGANGMWNINLSNLKDVTTNDVFGYATGDTITLFARGGAEGTVSETATITGTSPQATPDETLVPPTPVPVITVSKEGDYGGGSTTPGTLNVPFLQLGVQTDTGTATITSVKAKLTGTAVDGDISSFDVYDDADNSGTVSAGDTALGSATFSGGEATVTGLSFGVTTKSLLLVLDIAGGADPSHFVGLELTDNTFITSSDGTVASTNFPITNTNDTALPVVLASFSATFTTEGVTLNWRTESELNNLGFDVYRGKSVDGPFTKVTPALIKGAGTDSTPHSYKFIDESVGVDNTYYYYLENISFDGTRDRSDIIRVIIDKSGKLNVGLATPEFALLQNFPNPFNPETWIPFRLGQEADVTIRIFDVKGQNIRTIHLGRLSDGFYATRGKAAFWDGKDSFGESVSSGIYFYNLTAGDLSATKKLTVVK